jgi:Protein  of unknown function (DUF3018)/PemK-like, MazF-like toxin of type II toxin-antitoxin system
MADTGSRQRVRTHRERLRAKGLRPVQIWMPDATAEGFAAEAHRQSRAVAGSAAAEDDQAFVDSVSEWPPSEARGDLDRLWRRAVHRQATVGGDRAGRPLRYRLGGAVPVHHDPTDAPLFRLVIEPDAGNGLDGPSRIMVDKITTVRRSWLGSKVGVLDDANVLRLNRARGLPGDRQQHMTSQHRPQLSPPSR